MGTSVIFNPKTLFYVIKTIDNKTFLSFFSFEHDCDTKLPHNCMKRNNNFRT